MAELIIRHPGGRQSRLTLSRKPVRIGRGLECDHDLGADDAEVSRKHADIWLSEEGQVLVTDLRSKNGTRVDDGEPFWNETRVAQRVVHIGEHQFEIVRDVAAGDDSTLSDITFGPDRPPNAGPLTTFPSSKGFNLGQERLMLLMRLSERISGSFERRQLLEQALDSCFETLGFERGLVAVKTPRGDVEQPVTRNVQPEEVSRTLINRALIDGERAIVNDVATDLKGNLTDSLVRFPICSALSVPILHRGEVLGVIYGDRVTDTTARPYQREDVDFLGAIAQQVGVGLSNLRLFENRMLVEQYQRELERARAIQRRLLPRAPLQVGGIMAEGYNEPSAGVSGDYYDFIDLGDGRLGFVIADVVGHGLAAALLSTNLQAAMHVALSGTDNLPEIAARINRWICKNTESHVFITGILGMVEASTGMVRYVSAGHHGPIVVGNQRIEPMHCEGALPLGIEPNEVFDEHAVKPDDNTRVILFYTDGLIEASIPDGPLLGMAPVGDALAQMTAPTGSEVIKTLRALVRGHLHGESNEDDMTLLTLQYGSP